jgi:cell division protein FtsB
MSTPTRAPALTTAGLVAGLLAAANIWLGLSIAFGDQGLVTRDRLAAEAAAIQADLETLVARQAKLERRIELMKPETLDLDLLEERAREMLGYARPDEIVAEIREGEFAEFQ